MCNGFELLNIVTVVILLPDPLFSLIEFYHPAGCNTDVMVACAIGDKTLRLSNFLIYFFLRQKLYLFDTFKSF